MDHYDRVLAKFRGYFGILHTPRNSSRCYYKGPGHADFEHAFFAQSYGVAELYTSDRSFEDLNGD